MPDQFWLPKQHATVKRLDPYRDAVEVKTGLRVYKSNPDGITVQWRVAAKAGKPGAGTIVHGTLTHDEARDLANYLLTLTDPAEVEG